MNEYDKYAILYREIKKLGIKDESVIEELINNIDELSKTIIDLYVNENEEERNSNNLLQGINKRTGK